MSRGMEEANKEILDSSLQHIQSVPYKVGLRWAFYRLLQEGYYHEKGDYDKFKDLASTARKRYLRGWSPNTIIDDTRGITWCGYGAISKEEWLKELSCSLDRYQTKHRFLMIWFEARAMEKQFRYYTKDIPLAAFGGDASIPFKWDIAMAIRNAKERYNKPIMILYFGDLDDKGQKIYKAALKDIRAWSQTDFECIYCGLTKEQAEIFKLPENPDKPGQYQWEALTDEQAKAIITSQLLIYDVVDIKSQGRIIREEQKILRIIKKATGGEQ